MTPALEIGPVRSVKSLQADLVAACADRASIVVALMLLLTAVLMAYIATHFALTTDTYSLLSPKLAWRIRETAFNSAFPQNGSNVVIVLDGQTPELSEQAAAALAEHLAAQPLLFHSVQRPDGGAFWSHNGLLFASTTEVKSATAQLIKAAPFLGPMAADPSLRGLMTTLSLAAHGVQSNDTSLRELYTPFRTLADTLDGLASGTPAFFSWRMLMTESPPDSREQRHIILVDPALDFGQLEPGKLPTDAIRKIAQSLRLDAAHGVRVRLTGEIPLQDEEFATLAERAVLIAALASGAITLMLWLAVRSARLIASILVTTLVGLICATALGLIVFHQFNVISVAFIPLFVGLGIDIGIQFSVRYKAERSLATDTRAALIATGRSIGPSLTLAAVAIAAGFLAFAPTAYYGVSQLGIIAGLGLLMALALNLTVLPALIALTHPPGMPSRPINIRLTLIDHFVLGNRSLVLGTGAVAALISIALLPRLHFDFNPIHLRSTHVESVSTLQDLLRDPDFPLNTLEVVSPTLQAADHLAERFRLLPEVAGARTLSSFVPANQLDKLAIIADAENLLDLTINPLVVARQPSDAEVVARLGVTARDLRSISQRDASMRADTERLADALDRLANGSAVSRSEAFQALIPGLSTELQQIRDLLQPYPISEEMLPAELVRQWITVDGRARISISPAGDSNDNAVLSRFIRAGLTVTPEVTGTAISIQAGGQAVVNAFIEAGILSFVAISVLLWVTLRRVRDVAITMAPIVLTGLLTLGTCVLIGQSLNFANIIALPLLFGIGVAFHIYFVMAWRSGTGHLLTSSLATAVFFSALATATGFGSLWASSHPGTASMGKVLMISLVWTLASALLFQPALMGPPILDKTT